MCALLRLLLPYGLSAHWVVLPGRTLPQHENIALVCNSFPETSKIVFVSQAVSFLSAGAAFLRHLAPFFACYFVRALT
jgi:hypothetical protein